MKKANSGKNAAGFTLVEVIIATAMGLLVLGALYGIFRVFDVSRLEATKLLTINTDVIAALDLIYGDITMAGYNTDATGAFSLPICRGNFSQGTAVATNAPCLGVKYAGCDKITVTACPEVERLTEVTYDVYRSAAWETVVLGRAIGAASHQPLIALRGPGIANAEYLRWEYLTRDGLEATNLESIRCVRAKLTIFGVDGSSHNYTLDMSMKNIVSEP